MTGKIILPPLILPGLRSAAAWLVCGLLLCAVLPSLHAQHRFTRLHSFGATNLAMFAPKRLAAGRDGALFGTTASIGRGIVKVGQDGSNYTALCSVPASNGFPDVVLEGTDGALYGTTFAQFGEAGIVFKVNKDGTGFAVLHTFRHSPTSQGESALVLFEGSDRVLYGTTFGFFPLDQGTVFKLKKDGGGFAVLQTFLENEENGTNPQALLEGCDGVLYGTTVTGGGSGNMGTVFKLSKGGTDFTILHRFDVGAAAGRYPIPLLEGSDGVLYGMTMEDPAVFRLNKDGAEFAVVRQMEPNPDWDEWSSLVELADGALCGFQDKGGASGEGWLFKLNKDGTGFAPVHEFTGANGDGAGPYSSLVKAGDGTIYGTTDGGGEHGFGTLFKLNPDGTGYQVLTSFSGNVPLNDGNIPSGLIQASDGVLYGTTESGGRFGFGTVFRVQPDGTGYSVLHHFPGGSETWPRSPLLEGSDGWLYGTTRGEWSLPSVGTVFALRKDGTGYDVLHYFRGGTNDGARPEGALVEGPGRWLYGVTQSGGQADQGVVFKVDREEQEIEILHHFLHWPNDGGIPTGLLLGTDSMLYGVTYGGGTDPNGSWGTVFRLNTDGSSYQVLHSFLETETTEPMGALLEGSDGVLYGAGSEGDLGGQGGVFRLNKDGTGFRILHRFTGMEGREPRWALVEGSDGALYGTTEVGGSGGEGTVFRLNKDGGGYRTLWNFPGWYEGGEPRRLIEGRGGALYGTTGYGGDLGWAGILFRLEVAPVLYNPVWSGSVFSFQFNARSNVVYQPQFKASLAETNWTALPNITGQRVVTVTDTNLDSTPRFYRVVIP